MHHHSNYHERTINLSIIPFPDLVSFPVLSQIKPQAPLLEEEVREDEFGRFTTLSRGGRENSASDGMQWWRHSVNSFKFRSCDYTPFEGSESMQRYHEAFGTFVNRLPPEPEPFDFSQDPPESSMKAFGGLKAA